MRKLRQDYITWSSGLLQPFGTTRKFLEWTWFVLPLCLCLGYFFCLEVPFNPSYLNDSYISLETLLVPKVFSSHFLQVDHQLLLGTPTALVMLLYDKDVFMCLCLPLLLSGAGHSTGHMLNKCFLRKKETKQTNKKTSLPMSVTIVCRRTKFKDDTNHSSNWLRASEVSATITSHVIKPIILPSPEVFHIFAILPPFYNETKWS